jgi:hypothetical protein
MPTTSLTPLPMTLIGFMETRQAALCLSDHDLSASVGLEREITLKLIKAGTLKFPLARIPALAASLQLDAAELLKIALRESDPELAKLIEETFNPLHLSATEVDLIKHQRTLCGDAVGAPIALQVEDVIALAAA